MSDGSRSLSVASASSIAARSTAHSAAGASFTRIDGVERTIRALDESLNARFGLRQLLGRGAEILDALLEQRERARQLDIVALEFGGDGLEARQALLERHAELSADGRTCAFTMPSRTMRSN